MPVKRTLMHGNRELLDFEVNPVTGKACVLDASDANDGELASLGIDALDLDASLTHLVRGRCMTHNRADLPEILDAFGARSEIELVLKGRGVSLVDRFWYRAPGSAERWEDVNFFDNDWDDAFRASFLTGDYDALAACSPDIPDVTTRGRLRKAWERNGEGVFLLKEALRADGADLEGARLAAKLCSLLYGAGSYQPLSVQERHGKRFSASPLMLSRCEELVQGRRLFAICGIDAQEAERLAGLVSPEDLVGIFARAGISRPSAQVAKIAAFKNLALLADLHTGNFGIVCNARTGERRAAPPFDYDRSFGFPPIERPIEVFLENPQFAALLCAQVFSDLDSSWDWSWYDPQALEGFEERIQEAYARYCSLPDNFGKLVAWMFAVQRSYVNQVASA